MTYEYEQNRLMRESYYGGRRLPGCVPDSPVVREQQLPQYLDELTRWTRWRQENLFQEEQKVLQRSNNVEENGRAWLAKQPLHIRQAILGVKGEQEWKAGRAGWMEKARNLNISTVGYYGLKSRLRKFVNGIFGKESTTITYEVLPKIDGNPGIEKNAKI